MTAKIKIDHRTPADAYRQDVCYVIADKILPLEKLRKMAESDWRTENCCAVCHGYGHLIQYDTMDYFHSSYEVKCDKCGGVKADCPILPTDEESELSMLFQAADQVWTRLLELQNYPINCDVVVFKGRKVPIGTTGRVIRINDGKWGRSVLIESASGNHWTSIDNVRLVDGVKQAIDQLSTNPDYANLLPYFPLVTGA